MAKTILDTTITEEDFTAGDVTSEAWTPSMDQVVHSFQVTTRTDAGVQVLAPIMIDVVDKRPAYFRARWDLVDTRVYIEGSNHPEQSDMWSNLGDSGAFAVGIGTQLFVYAN